MSGWSLSRWAAMKCTGAADASLDFVEHEEGAMFLAEAFDGGEVTGGGWDDAGFALEWLEDDGGRLVLAKGGFEGGDVTEGDFVGLGKHGAEALFPESVAHEREGAAGEAVEGSLGVDDAVTSGEDAGKLDDGFDAFAAGAAEEGLSEVRPGESGEALGERASGVSDVTLQHRGAGGFELVDESFDDVGMVMAGVVDTVAGEEVEDDASVFGVELGADTATVLDVHAEEVQEAGPLGIDEAAVCGVWGLGGGRRIAQGREEFGVHGYKSHLSMTLFRYFPLAEPGVKESRRKRMRGAISYLLSVT